MGGLIFFAALIAWLCGVSGVKVAIVMAVGVVIGICEAAK